MKNSIAIFVGLFIFVSCATPNPYSQWYTQYYEGALIPTDNVQVIKSSPDDYLSTMNELFTQGYGLIGETAFNWDYKDSSFAVEHAKSIGADILVLYSNYTDTSTYTSGVVSYGLGVAPVTSSQRRYDQNALYFSKNIEKGRYGFRYSSLTAEEKQRLQTNHGLKISVVVNNSPMQKAGAIPGDVILEIDGRKVLTNSDIYDDGLNVALKILRNGEEMELFVEFFDY